MLMCGDGIYSLYVDATVVLARYVIVQNNKRCTVLVLKFRKYSKWKYSKMLIITLKDV